MTEKLFLSHSHSDKQDAQALRRALEDSGVAVWEDMLELRAGDRLNDLEERVKSSRGLIVLWTAAANESQWVDREASWAREAREMKPGYKILVVLRGAQQISARRLLGEELLFIQASSAVEDAVSQIRMALDERAALGREPEPPRPAPLLEELVISFSDTRVEESDGFRRAAGRFRIEHRPAQPPGGRGPWMEFESPLGSLELEELRWYLERYPGWPFGAFRNRAASLESKLPAWGRALYRLTIERSIDQVQAWRLACGAARRIVVEVDEQDNGAGLAALFALPWELLADEDGYLFEGGLRARVVRRIARQRSLAPLPIGDRLRVLLVIARPEEEGGVGLLDPRSCAGPLIEALASLGPRADLEVLVDGTLPALRDALTRAEASARPFHVVHFDGHGIYDKEVGLGKLCFENPADAEENKVNRRAELVDADQLGSLLRERRVPLFVLEAYPMAMANAEGSSSVATRLLRAGVGSIVVMTHPILLDAARRFTRRFYECLAAGDRIGTAMIEANHFLRDNPGRGTVGEIGGLELQDWFVPVLFQESEGDRHLLQIDVRPDLQELANQRRIREGELPASPAHGFVGRARELLTVQRLLRDERILTLLGEGGQGKTALAVESAKWLLDLGHCERVTFVCMEGIPDARLVLDRIGRQLLSGYSVAKEEGAGTQEERLRRARLPIERILGERRVLLVADNLESVLSSPENPELPEQDELLDLLRRFSSIGETRLLITSREVPPTPLGGRSTRIGPLSKAEGRLLVSRVLARSGSRPVPDSDVQWLDDLVDQTGGRARSLVLLAPVVAECGVRVTSDALSAAMDEIERRHRGVRDLSLLASVRVSLDRLPSSEREQIRAFVVFHGPLHLIMLAHVAAIRPDEALALGQRLADFGLADLDGPYLFPNPAVGPAVRGELTDDEFDVLTKRWVEAGLLFIMFLSEVLRQDAVQAMKGAQFVLANLIAAVAMAEELMRAGMLYADRLMLSVAMLQQIVRALGLPKVLGRIDAIRLCVLQRLGEWDHARFMSKQTEIDDLLHSREIERAVRVAEELSSQADAAGDAYPEAAYDRAMGHYQLGKASVELGRVSVGISHIVMARAGFVELADSGNQFARNMLSGVAIWRGTGLRKLGQLDRALESFQGALTLAVGNSRNTAISLANIAITHSAQGKLQEALKGFEQAREYWDGLREPEGLAQAWLNIGTIHEKRGSWDRAEHAYQTALRSMVELGHRAGQAAVLGQMGDLYGNQGRLGESVVLHQQALTIRLELGDPLSRARSERNVAQALFLLRRIDEARDVAISAGTLAARIGNAAAPWEAFALIEKIEMFACNYAAAVAARKKAMDLYSAYRLSGGNAALEWRLVAATVGEPPQEDAVIAMVTMLDATAHAGASERIRPLLEVLLAIARGSRDEAIVQDERLDYRESVELARVLALADTIDQAIVETRTGELDSAIRLWENLADDERAPESSRTTARYNRGVTQGQLGRVEVAIADYTVVLEAPHVGVAQRAMALVNRGFSYAQQGHSDQAISDYNSVLAMPDADGEVRATALGNRSAVFVEKGRADDAIADCNAVLESDDASAATRAMALLNRGLAHAQQGRLDEAIADCTAVLANRDASAETRAKALFNRGLNQELQGRLEAATSDYTSVVEIGDAPGRVRAMALVNRGFAQGKQGWQEEAVADYSVVIAMPDAPVDQRAKALLNRGIIHARQGRPKESIEDYTAVIDAADAPAAERARALGNRGATLAQEGRADEAIADYSAVVTMPDVSVDLRVRTLLNRGGAHVAIECHEKAIDDYTTVVETVDAPAAMRAEGLLGRAWTWQQRGRLDKAITDYATVAAMRDALIDQRGEALFCHATAIGLDQPEEASAGYTALLAMPGVSGAQRSRALLNRGVIHAMHGRREEAITDFAAVTEEPGVPTEELANALSCRAFAYGRDRPEAAIADYTALLAIPETSAEVRAGALLNRSVVYDGQGQSEAASADISALLAMPDAPSRELALALTNRAWTRFCCQPPDLAGLREDSEAALKLVPELIVARFNLGLALFLGGQEVQALVEYTRAAREAGDATQVRVAREDLERATVNNLFEAGLQVLALLEGREAELKARVPGGPRELEA